MGGELLSHLRSSARHAFAALVLAAIPLALPAAAAAQARLAEGQVLRAVDGSAPAPVAGQWVVLHRVGSDAAGPVDSARTGANGRFRFRYAATGSPDALYFMSAHYAGIAYFSPPLRSATVRGGDADVMVYDTTTDTAALRLQGRHLVIAQPRGTRRDVAEIFEIENQGARTIVVRDSVTPLWTTTVPVEAESIAVAPGDIAASAVVFRPGRAELYAPMSPGVRQLVLTYMLPVDAMPASIPAARETSVLEVLVEESRAEVTGAGLTETAPVPIEGRTFRRFLAQDVAANAVVRVDAPEPAGQNAEAQRVLLVFVAVAMLGALGFWFLRRGPRRSAPLAAGDRRASTADQLIAQLAALDTRFERAGGDRAAYEAERTALKRRIQHALAAADRAP